MNALEAWLKVHHELFFALGPIAAEITAVVAVTLLASTFYKSYLEILDLRAKRKERESMIKRPDSK